MVTSTTIGVRCLFLLLAIETELVLVHMSVTEWSLAYVTIVAWVPAGLANDVSTLDYSLGAVFADQFLSLLLFLFEITLITKNVF